MKLFSKLFLYFTIAILLIWQLPWCYAFLTLKPVKLPFTLYSHALNDFIETKGIEGKQLGRFDTKGNSYTQHQVDSLLPCFYARQLMADERFPDSIGGVAVTPKEIKRTNFIFKSSPSEINTPSSGLYFLMESMSGRVDLKMPKDAFRFTQEGIEFIHMESNQSDTAKSQLFTEVMKKKGFTFPVSYASGNPSTHKEYDNGYLLLDAQQRLFHLKCTKGLPYIKAIPLPEGVQATHVFLTEFNNRELLGLLVDRQHQLYIIQRKGQILKSGLPAFNPSKDNLVIFGNKFNWTVKHSNGTDECFYALHAKDYSLLQSLEHKNVYPSVPGLSFTAPTDKFVKPRF